MIAGSEVASLPFSTAIIPIDFPVRQAHVSLKAAARPGVALSKDKPR
jgi:hypothetical protein